MAKSPIYTVAICLFRDSWRMIAFALQISTSWIGIYLKLLSLQVLRRTWLLCCRTSQYQKYWLWQNRNQIQCQERSWGWSRSTLLLLSCLFRLFYWLPFWCSLLWRILQRVWMPKLFGFDSSLCWSLIFRDFGIPNFRIFSGFFYLEPHPSLSTWFLWQSNTFCMWNKWKTDK